MELFREGCPNPPNAEIRISMWVFTQQRPVFSPIHNLWKITPAKWGKFQQIDNKGLDSVALDTVGLDWRML
jgi:hypothetical protein